MSNTFFLRLGLPIGSPGEEGKKGSLLIDVALVAGLFALVAAMVALAQRWNAPIREAVVIDLNPRALPGYTLLSLSRGLAAYVLSLVFTLVYGTVAAHSRRAEKVMIPLLDIGQGFPCWVSCRASCSAWWRSSRERTSASSSPASS